MRDVQAPARSVSRFAWRAALLAAALVLGAWGALVVEHRFRRDPLRAAWKQTIAEMRAAGEPLAASDLRGERLGPGHELGAWLDGFEPNADYRWVTPKSLGHPRSGTYSISAAGVRLPAPSYLTRGGGLDTWLVLQAVLGEERAWADMRSGDAAALEALRELRVREAALFTGLESLDAIEGLDAEKWTERALDVGSATQPNATTAFAAAEMLALDALLAGVDGDRDTIEKALRRLLVLARLSTDAPTLSGQRAGGSVLCVTKVVIEASIDLLSISFVADELEPALAALDLRAGLVRAMRAETLLLIASPAIRRSLEIAEDAAPEELALHLDVVELEDLHDELSRRRAIAAAFALPFVAGRAGITAACGTVSSTFRAPVATPFLAGAVLPFTVTSGVHVSSCLAVQEQSIARELELAFTRLRLRAHATGVEAARELAATMHDPYDGLPLRWRVEADGTLSVWSVGPDGVDASGAVPGGGALGDDVLTSLSSKR